MEQIASLFGLDNEEEEYVTIDTVSLTQSIEELSIEGKIRLPRTVLLPIFKEYLLFHHPWCSETLATMLTEISIP